MTKIPEWIEKRIEFDAGKDVQDRHIVETFLSSNRPYQSRQQIQETIGLSSQGTRDRLNKLEEKGVVESDAVANSRVYWIRNEKSDWPIPPDVQVEPISDSPTVADLLDRLYVRFGIVAVLLTMIGGILVIGFAGVLIAGIEMPVIQTSDLLVWAVTAVAVGYLFVIASGVFWILEE